MANARDFGYVYIENRKK